MLFELVLERRAADAQPLRRARRRSLFRLQRLEDRLALDATRPLKDRVGEAVRTVEKQAILEALQAEQGSPTRAAKRLGISRASFYNKLKEHDIRV